MKKTLLTLSIALASLFATSAFAQKDAAGEARAAPSTPATQAEKDAAKSARKTIGAEAAKKGPDASDQPGSMGKTKVVSKSDQALAKAKRKAEGTDATKAPKDQSGPSK